MKFLFYFVAFSEAGPEDYTGDPHLRNTLCVAPSFLQMLERILIMRAKRRVLLHAFRTFKISNCGGELAVLPYQSASFLTVPEFSSTFCIPVYTTSQ